MTDTLDPLARRVLGDLEEFKSDRSAEDSQWERLRKLFWPQRTSFVSSTETQGQRDRRTTVNLMGAQAVLDITDFTMASIINAQADWFNLRLSGSINDLSPPEADWLAEAQSVMLRALHDPHGFFERAMRLTFMERYGIGNGCVYIGDRPGRLPHYVNVPMKQHWWDQNADGETDTHLWVNSYTARKAVQKFGKANVDAAVAEAAETPNGSRTRFEYIHACIPNADFDEGSEAPPAQRFVSVWIEKHTGRSLFKPGYSRTCAYVAFMADREEGQRYGRGEADLALEDVSMAQRISVAGIRAIEKAGDPPLIVPDDGVISMPSHESRSMVVVRADLMRGANDPIRTMPVSGKPELLFDFAEMLEKSTRKRFRLDKINLPREPRMPVQHVLALQEEQARDTAPLLGTQLAPLATVIERTGDLLWRARLLSPIPNRNGRVFIEFDAPIVRAMKLGHARAFMQALETAQMAMPLDSTVQFAVKWADGVRDVARVTGVKPSLIATDDQMQAGGEAQAELARQKAAMETAKDGTTALKNLAAPLKAANDVAGGEGLGGEAPVDLGALLQAGAA